MKSTLPLHIKLIDSLLHPFMIILGGFNGDSVQRTHPWHHKDFNPELINDSNSVNIKGRDKSKVSGVWLGLFHMPIFGGWKSYVILRPKEPIGTWFVGWKGEKYTQVSIIPLDGMVKALTGIENTETHFFGLDENNNFIELEIVDFGENGDLKFMTVPLL